MKELLQELATHIVKKLPNHYGFFMVVFPFGREGRANYISNAQRKDVINSMKEWLIKCSAEEDWMKDLN